MELVAIQDKTLCRVNSDERAAANGRIKNINEIKMLKVHFREMLRTRFYIIFRRN